MAAEKNSTVVMKDPPYIDALFSSPKMAWLWLIVRVYVGWAWLTAGWGKATNAAWVDSGVALRGFWMNAAAVPEGGRAAITYDWYREFLRFMIDKEAYSWMGAFIAYGQVLVGLGLILGGLTGVAAFFGAFMNFNFMLAGSASTNPVMFTLAVLILIAWKNAGWIGIDRWLLPMMGTPWSAGPLPLALFKRRKVAASSKS